MRFRLAGVLGIVLAAFVIVGFPGAGEAVTAATVSASPAADLLDGQTITVSGAGFDQNVQVGTAECLDGATEPGQCDLTGVSFTTTDNSGSFSIGFNVTRFINVGGVIIDCGIPNSCVLGTEETANPALSTTVGISFQRVPVVPPVVHVDPSTNLVDHQSVHIEGSGFTPRSSIAVIECISGSTAISDCDLATILIVNADSNGTFDGEYQVARMITVNGSSVDCGGPAGCVVGAGGVDIYVQRGLVPIFFSSAPISKPTVLVAPSTSLLDGQTVTVTGSGFSPTANVLVSECRSPVTGPSDCAAQTDQLTSADASGSISTQYKVARYIQVAMTTVDCSVTGACQLEVSDVNDFGQGSGVAIAFEVQAAAVSNQGQGLNATAGSLAMTGYDPWWFVWVGCGSTIVGVAMLAVSRWKTVRRRPQGQPASR